jgi:hypothetical protein
MRIKIKFQAQKWLGQFKQFGGGQKGGLLAGGYLAFQFRQMQFNSRRGKKLLLQSLADGLVHPMQVLVPPLLIKISIGTGELQVVLDALPDLADACFPEGGAGAYLREVARRSGGE